MSNTETVETLMLGAFDNIKTNASEVAYLWNRAAQDGAVYPADAEAAICASMERIEHELADVRLRLAYSRGKRA